MEENIIFFERSPKKRKHREGSHSVHNRAENFNFRIKKEILDDTF